MKLGRLPWQQLPDDQYIANQRRLIRFLDRCRPWWILLNIGLLAATVWVFTGVFNLLIGLVEDPKWAILGFSIGASAGFAFSCISWVTFINVVFAIGNCRSERLLLRYYDAFHVEKADHNDKPTNAAET